MDTGTTEERREYRQVSQTQLSARLPAVSTQEIESGAMAQVVPPEPSLAAAPPMHNVEGQTQRVVSANKTTATDEGVGAGASTTSA